MTNLADHLKASAEITKHVEDADALARKLGSMLSNARATLEALRTFAPDNRFTVDMPYHLRSNSVNSGSMSDIIRRQVEAINNALGDRAS